LADGRLNSYLLSCVRYRASRKTPPGVARGYQNNPPKTPVCQLNSRPLKGKFIFLYLSWAHPRAYLPVGQDGPRTGLYACIFFAFGKKGYRSNPLRVPKSGIHAGFWHRSLPAANSIYPPFADSNVNSGIHAAFRTRYILRFKCPARF
jgi:hypothetical protein